MRLEFRDLDWIESRLEWYLSIPNEFNRKRLVSDGDLVALIAEKLRRNELEY